MTVIGKREPSGSAAGLAATVSEPAAKPLGSRSRMNCLIDMTRERLNEFRKVRKGAVMLHWTARDASEYQAWLSRRPVSDRAMLSVVLLALVVVVPLIHHHNLNHHLAHGAIVKH